MTTTPLIELLVSACCSTSPQRYLAEQLPSHRQRLDPAEIAWLQTIDGAGLEQMSRTAQPRRFARILAGDPALRESFARDPEGLREDFELYTDTVDSEHHPASAEAAAFRDYMDLLG